MYRISYSHDGMYAQRYARFDELRQVCREIRRTFGRILGIRRID
jgi:hypothetical protein